MNGWLMVQNLKKNKKVPNVAHPPLLAWDKNKIILEHVNIPVLHILLGVFTKY